MSPCFKNDILTYNAFQTSRPSYIRQLFTIQPPWSTRSSSYLSLSRPPVSSSLKFCNRSVSMPHQLFGMNFQKTSVSLLILLPGLFPAYTPLSYLRLTTENRTLQFSRYSRAVLYRPTQTMVPGRGGLFTGLWIRAGKNLRFLKN